jgi:hypothetical protein
MVLDRIERVKGRSNRLVGNRSVNAGEERRDERSRIVADLEKDSEGAVPFDENASHHLCRPRPNDNLGRVRSICHTRHKGLKAVGTSASQSQK